MHDEGRMFGRQSGANSLYFIQENNDNSEGLQVQEILRIRHDAITFVTIIVYNMTIYGVQAQ